MSVENRASAKFDSGMEDALARLPDQRFQIVLQIVASSIDAGKLDRLFADLEKLPEGSAKRDAIDLAKVIDQLTAAAPQIVALDLDRSTPLRILGMGRATAPVLFAAKCFGHDVTMAGRPNFAVAQLVKLFDIPCAEAKTPDEFPDESFDLIITYGGPNLGAKPAWSALLLPLAGKLAEGGRIFVVLAKQVDARKKYYPDLVLNKLARVGARVSSRHGFVLFGRAAAKTFAAAPAAVNEAVETAVVHNEKSKEPDVEAAGPRIEHQSTKPKWRGVALIGSFVALIGLLVATWAGH